MLTISSGSYYVLNEHEDFYQYGLFTITIHDDDILNHPVSLVNQNEIPIVLLCQWPHLVIIMMSMKMLTNMTHMQYPLR